MSIAADLRARADAFRNRERVRVLLTTAAPQIESVRAISKAVADRARPVTSAVTKLGWGTVAFGFVCWLVGQQCGWSELLVIATAAWLLWALCAMFVLGRTRLEVTLVADPQRVTVGDPAAGSVSARNVSQRPMLPVGLELPIGPGAARFTLPYLAPNADHEELFVVPTGRRGVVNVGPAMTVRGDPFGLMRRAVSWTESLDIFVHPITVHLDSVGAGLLRDLEGQTSNDLSRSDLAFHALREYSPGDDRRFIHWKSSAKAGRFLVKQFLDTRRSHACVIVDSNAADYADTQDFELAISAAASITVRVVKDEQEVTILAGEHAAPSASGSTVLDIYSRANLADHGIHDLARRAIRLAPDASIAFLVAGSLASFADLQRAAAEFPIEVHVIAIQVDPTKPSTIRSPQGLTVIGLQRLGDLASLLQGGLS